MWKWFKQWLLPEELPVLIKMPDHVANMSLDVDLLWLQMQCNHNLNPAVNSRPPVVPNK